MPEKTTKHNDGFIKGRGAQFNPPNPFSREIRINSFFDGPEPEKPASKTSWIETHPKTIINEVKSPDIGMNFSVNPYQGCEHGCSYCYARNTHTYWGYSAGLDFESKILVKKDASRLLEKELSSNSWKGDPIMLSGNTDCYQPIEKELRITRSILEVCWNFKNPVGVITKNALMLRDLDIISTMNQHRLIKCSVSLNTLDDKTRQKLEPRASSVKTRMNLIRRLSDAGVPVNVMIAPVIPGINHHEIHNIMEEVASIGAADAKYIIIRLNGDVQKVFMHWLRKCYPDRADKVLNQIAGMHGGRLSDSRFGKRMKGEGKIAEIIRQQYELAYRCFFKDRSMPDFDLSLFHRRKNPQLSLF